MHTNTVDATEYFDHEISAFQKVLKLRDKERLQLEIRTVSGGMAPVDVYNCRNEIRLNLLRDGNVIAYIFKFQLGNYPACCGLTLFDNFHTGEYGGFTKAPEQLPPLFALFDRIMKYMESGMDDSDYRTLWPSVLCYDQRIQLVMVQLSEDGHELEESTDEAEPTCNPDELEYGLFYEWLKTRHIIQHQHAFLNTNSGNICQPITALLNL